MEKKYNTTMLIGYQFGLQFGLFTLHHPYLNTYDNASFATCLNFFIPLFQQPTPYTDVLDDGAGGPYDATHTGPSCFQVRFVAKSFFPE